MPTSRRVVEQHEDWLNLTDAEAPWFSLPALKRALANGLDPTPPELRAEHRVRWYGDDDPRSARLAEDRHDYIDWLLRDALGWGADYLTGEMLPEDLATGVTRYDVTVVPTGVYHPAPAAPVGLFGEPSSSGDRSAPGAQGPRVLVLALPAGTDPRTRGTPATRGLRPGCSVRRCYAAISTSPSRSSQMGTTSPSCMPQSRRRHRLGHLARVGVRYRARAVRFVPVDAGLAALHRCATARHARGTAEGIRRLPGRGHPTSSARRFGEPPSCS